VWPVFVVFIVTIAACIVVQVPVVLLMLASKIVSGDKLEESLEVFQTPAGLIALGIGPQLVMLAAWWLASSYLDPRARRHRAIGRSSLSLPAYLCLMVASIAVLWLGDPLAQLGLKIFGAWSSDELVSKLFDDMTWPTGIALVFFISLPGFTEELFYRGFMQRRLLDRWPPAAALPVAAVLFALSHGTPVWALAVLPLGFWFGPLAWRTGSLWPGICCHAFVNGSVNLWRVGAATGTWTDEPGPRLTWGTIATCLACLAISLWILFRRRGHQPESQATEAREPGA
jgi:membrane protease YdiL (CAAX protease family)